MNAPTPIASFECGVSGIKSMADGSPRFEFEAGEDAIEYMTPLGQAKADKRYLIVMVFDADEWKRFETANSKD